MVEKLSEYKARKYQQGDEDAFVSLFNAEYTTFGGFVPRTTEYWRWSCLERPDVEREGIIVLENANQIVGYSVTSKSGSILELCADSTSDKNIIVLELLSKTLDYATGVGCNSVVINAPISDPDIRNACQKLNFAESKPEPVFLSALDLPNLIQKIVESKKISFDEKVAFWFSLRNAPVWASSTFGIALDKNSSVLLNEPPASKIALECDMSTLVDLLFGAQSPFRAIVSKKILVSPYRHMPKVLKFLGLLQTKEPWFIPRSDMG